MSLLYLNCYVEAVASELAQTTDPTSKILAANQTLRTAKLIRNCCRRCDDTLRQWQRGAFNGFKSVDDCADLLHDIALGVLEPGNWRAKQLVLVPAYTLPLFAADKGKAAA